MHLNPLNGFLNAATGGNWWLLLARTWSRVAKPDRDNLSSQAYQDRGRVNDKWDEDRWVRKGGKRGKVACGSLIESRSGLSWWGGGDDRERMEGRGGGGLQGLWQPHTAYRMTTGSGSALTTPLLCPPLFLYLSNFSVPSHPSPQRNWVGNHAYQTLLRMCED